MVDEQLELTVDVGGEFRGDIPVTLELYPVVGITNGEHRGLGGGIVVTGSKGALPVSLKTSFSSKNILPKNSFCFVVNQLCNTKWVEDRPLWG